MTRTLLAALLFAAAPALADDGVPVPGSAVKFPTALNLPVDGKPTALKLTGVGLRTRAIFNVYAIGSYVQDGAAAATAEQLIAADAPKLFYMVLERDLSTKTILEALRSAIAAQGQGDKFAAEFAQLDAAFGEAVAKKGDHFSMFYTPGGHLKVQLVNKVDLTITNAEFCKAVWAIYLGGRPIDERMKAGLTARLGR